MTDNRDRVRGSFLRDARKEVGMTQIDLSNAMDVGQGTVSRWEGGLPISSEYIAKLEDILGVDLSPYIEVEDEDDAEEWLPVLSAKDMARYVISVTRRVTDDEDLRMALILLVKDEWLSHDIWMVMVSKDALVKELGLPLFNAVWPAVLSSPWVERVSGAEYVLRLKYPSPG